MQETKKNLKHRDFVRTSGCAQSNVNLTDQARTVLIDLVIDNSAFRAADSQPTKLRCLPLSPPLSSLSSLSSPLLQTRVVSKSANESNKKEKGNPRVTQGLPLLTSRPGLALVSQNGVKFDLDGVVLGVATVPLAPVVADGVGKDVSVLAEAGCDDAAADFRVALETVLGVLVPEVEGTVGTGSGEGAVLGVEGDGVYGVDLCDVAVGGVLLAVALEGEVEAR